MKLSIGKETSTQKLLLIAALVWFSVDGDRRQVTSGRLGKQHHVEERAWAWFLFTHLGAGVGETSYKKTGLMLSWRFLNPSWPDTSLGEEANPHR